MECRKTAVRQTTIRITPPRARVVDHRGAGAVALRAEQEDVADRLRGRQPDGQVARVLRDPLLPDLALPSCSFSSDGETTVRSCRMIEAVMYGMIPSANSASRAEAAAAEQVQEAEDVEPA